MQPVGVQRRGDLFADELTHPLAGDRPRQPGEQPSVRQGVVGRLAAQPRRRRGRHPLLHPDVVHQVGLAQAVEVGQARAVPHHLADGDLGLAVGAELGPVLGDRRVVVDQSAVGEAVDDRRCHALGGGEHHRPGVGLPRHPAAAVRPPGPDVHHGLTVQVDGQCTTTEAPVREHGREAAHCAGEVRIRCAVYAIRERGAALPSRCLVHNQHTLPTCRGKRYARYRSVTRRGVPPSPGRNRTATAGHLRPRGRRACDHREKT